MSTTETRQTRSVEETLDVAAKLAQGLRGGDVVHLRGELGAGKTHFVKGLARGLGLDPDDVVSPTFTFVNVHRGAGPSGLGLVHVDLYRVGDPSELTELGLQEIPGSSAVAAVEWPERLPAHVAPPTLVVTLDDLGGSLRRVTVSRCR